MWKRILFIAFLSGCNAPEVRHPILPKPQVIAEEKSIEKNTESKDSSELDKDPELDKNAEPEPKIELTQEQRDEINKSIQSHKKLLEILTQIESDIKSKKNTADFFDFALDENDLVTLGAADILLDYLKHTKVDIIKRIDLLEKSLEG